METTLRKLKSIIPKKFFTALQPRYHFFLAFCAGLYYWFPSRHLVVIGVTGTKGKTTVVELLHEILSASGNKTASLSSYAFRVGSEDTRNDKKMTMPGRFFTQQFLWKARHAGCKYAVLEVTSEGVAQFRHRFIHFHAAVMTNVAPEHIESHGSFERYLRAKLDLFFRMAHKDAIAVINKDDPQWERFAASTSAKKVFYGKKMIEIDGKIKKIGNVKFGQETIEFEIEGNAIKSKLEGEFNFYNICAALAVAEALHISFAKIAEAIKNFAGVPGRMEYVVRDPVSVIVDYAHTPDSLRAVYSTIRAEKKAAGETSRLICVLGAAGGGRDHWKRPVMGKIAEEFCDEIIITNEDPYDEDPMSIIDAVGSGIHGGKKTHVKKIIDRKEAIREALASASQGDVVMVTGKGSELFIMGPNGQKIPWDDRGVVREEWKKLKQ